MRIAVAQMGVESGETAANVMSAISAIETARDEGVEFLILPECGLTGYGFADRTALESGSLTARSEAVGAVAEAAATANMHVVFGFFETFEGKIYNTAQLVGPTGVLGTHRKRHLPFLGGDRFADRSVDASPSVYETPFGKVGIAICYEIRFPEAVRTLMLSGAEIVALPTNWPEDSVMLAEHFTKVRAAENMIFFAAANRNDSDGDTKYLGMSQIVDPLGKVLVNAEQESGVFWADIDVGRAREKKIVFRPGEFEITPVADRQPQTYRN